MQVSALFLICALAPAPWAFIDPLSVEAKITVLSELMIFKDRYPEWEFQFQDKKSAPADHPGWEPTPWVFKNWRLYARRAA